jgi:hypothetical protein
VSRRIEDFRLCHELTDGAGLDGALAAWRRSDDRGRSLAVTSPIQAVVRVIAAVALAASLLQPSGALAGPLPGSITRLIGTADDLYGRAAAIVARTPTSRMGGALLANPSAAGGMFYTRERAFQDAVSALPATGELESTRAQATVRLGQFDNFVHAAVADALATCNAAEARANLRVARELLEELHRVTIGKGHAGWDPPGFDAALHVASGNRCS